MDIPQSFKDLTEIQEIEHEELSRYDTARMQYKYATLAQHPEMQAETIALHYASHASTAMDMMEAIEAKKHLKDSEDLDGLINHYKKILLDAHREDLGIELKWVWNEPK